MTFNNNGINLKVNNQVYLKTRPKVTNKISHIQDQSRKTCCKTYKWLHIPPYFPFNASTGLVLIRRWLPFRKTPSNAQSTNNGGVSGETFRRWLRTDAAFLRANHITPKTKILPPARGEISLREIQYRGVGER